MSQKILITGIPGCGKSTFGRWLRDTHGYTFINMEAEPLSAESLDAAGLRASWESFHSGEDRKQFIEDVTSKSPIVLDWGFPLGASGTISALIRSGIDSWWFDGDRLTAREYFAKRNTVPLINFDIQFANIAGNWNLVETMFRRHIIKVALTDGSLLPPEKIFEIIKAA
jgi:shikimate kinase